MNFSKPTHRCEFCGALIWYEERNKKLKRITKPKFFLYYMEGKIQHPPLMHLPSPLNNLLNYHGEKIAKHFCKNIRAYTSMFSFTSIGSHIDNQINKIIGSYVIKLNTQNHQRIRSLLPITSGKPCFI